jgi:hypothetical protein
MLGICAGMVVSGRALRTSRDPAAEAYGIFHGFYERHAEGCVTAVEQLGRGRDAAGVRESQWTVEVR